MDPAGGGVILSVVFLRCGGLHRDRTGGWAAATAAHVPINAMLWFVAHFDL
jgi:hypothetical protein